MAQFLDLDSNRFGVDVPHQFAYVLFLAPERTMRPDALCFDDGFAKTVTQRQFVQSRFRQRDQFFAEFLQCEMLAFSGAFTGL